MPVHDCLRQRSDPTTVASLHNINCLGYTSDLLHSSIPQHPFRHIFITTDDVSGGNSAGLNDVCDEHSVDRHNFWRHNLFLKLSLTSTITSPTPERMRPTNALERPSPPASPVASLSLPLSYLSPRTTKLGTNRPSRCQSARSSRA